MNHVPLRFLLFQQNNINKKETNKLAIKKTQTKIKPYDEIVIMSFANKYLL